MSRSECCSAWLRFTATPASLATTTRSIYRFRGASVRNLLEFPERFREAEVIRLTVNYRSHPGIVRAFDRWMASADWTNPKPGAPPFRYQKVSSPHAAGSHPDYSSVIAVLGRGPRDEAQRLAELLRAVENQWGRHQLRSGGLAAPQRAGALLPRVLDRSCQIRHSASSRPRRHWPQAPGVGSFKQPGVSADRLPHRPRTGHHHPPGERPGVAGGCGGIAGRFRRWRRCWPRAGPLQPPPSLRAGSPDCALRRDAPALRGLFSCPTLACAHGQRAAGAALRSPLGRPAPLAAPGRRRAGQAAQPAVCG